MYSTTTNFLSYNFFNNAVFHKEEIKPAGINFLSNASLLNISADYNGSALFDEKSGLFLLDGIACDNAIDARVLSAIW